MKNFSKFKAILWDFDGVIMDSMSIRDKGFEVTLSSFPNKQVQELLEYHRINGGLSRYVKFRYFYEDILGEPIVESHVNMLASRFSEVMMELLIDERLLINDSLDFIKKKFSIIPMHIVSGSDGKELNEICKRLNISKFFKSINGSPTPKKQLVANVLEENKLRKDEVVLIGDSINDYDAANFNDINFIGYNNHKLSTIPGTAYIEQFHSLSF